MASSSPLAEDPGGGRRQSGLRHGLVKSSQKPLYRTKLAISHLTTVNVASVIISCFAGGVFESLPRSKSAMLDGGLQSHPGAKIGHLKSDISDTRASSRTSDHQSLRRISASMAVCLEFTLSLFNPML